MQYAKGFKTSASPSWVAALLVGSNDVQSVRFVTRGRKYLLVCTAADLVVIEWSAQARIGYCTLAGGFAKADMANGIIYMVGATDKRVYKIALTSVLGDSTGSMSVFWSSIISVDGVTLAGNNAADIRCETVGTTGVVYVKANPYIFVARVGSTTDAFVLRGADEIVGGFDDNSVAVKTGRYVHAWLDTEAQESYPHVSWGRVYDDFTDGAIEDNWVKSQTANCDTTVAEQNDHLEIAHNSDDGSEAVLFETNFAALAGPIGVEVDWNVTAWPTHSTGDFSGVGFSAKYRDESWSFSITRIKSDDGEVVMAEVYEGATLRDSAVLPYTADSGTFRIIRSDNDEDPDDWEDTYSYPDSDWAGPTPKYKIELQYDDAGTWVTVFTVRTNERQALVFSLVTATTAQSGAGALECYFDNYTASDQSPEVYRRLYAADIDAAACAIMTTAADGYRVAVLQGEDVYSFDPAGTIDDDYHLASATIINPIVEIAAAGWTQTIPENGSPFMVLPGTPSSIAIADDEDAIYVGTDAGIASVPVNANGTPVFDPDGVDYYFDSELPSLPVVSETIVGLSYSGDGWIAYATATGAGAIAPDDTPAANPTSTIATLDQGPDPNEWDLAWTDPTDEDFYATVIGRIATDDPEVEDDILYLCDESGGAAWRKRDDWSDEFDEEDTDRWQLASGAVVASGALTITKTGAGATVAPLVYAETGDIDASVEFSGLSFTTPDPGDAAWGGLIFWADANNYAFIGRKKTSAADTWLAQVVIGGVTVANDVSEATTVASGTLRLIRRGDRVSMIALGSDETYEHVVAEYGSFTPAAGRIGVAVASENITADSVMVFDDLVVKRARPRYDFQTDGAEIDMLYDYRYYARSVDEAANLGDVTGFSQSTGDFDEDTGDPFLDHFIMANTLVDPGITVIRRTEQAVYRLGDPVPGTTNQGRARLHFADTELDEDDVALRVMALSGNQQSMFGVRPDHIGDGWMGRGGITSWADPVLVDSAASGIHDPRMAETDSGDLLIAYEKAGTIWGATVDRATGDITTAKLFFGTSPALAYHKTTGRTILAYVDSANRIVARRFQNGEWTTIGTVSGKRSGTYSALTMCSGRIFGSERMLLAFAMRGDTPVTILASDDAGESWRWASEQDTANDSQGDISLTAGPADAGDVFTLTASSLFGSPLARVSYLFLSKDGAIWEYRGVVNHGGSSESTRYARIAALPQQAMIAKPYTTDIWSNWTAVYWINDDDVTVTQLQVAKPPTKWGTTQGGDSLNGLSSSQKQETDVVLGGIDPNGPAGTRPYISGLALGAWGTRLAMLTLIGDRSGKRAIYLWRTHRWQRPADVQPYSRHWLPCFGSPYVHGAWTRTASGTAEGVNDEYMEILSLGSAYCYFKDQTVNVPELDDGARVRFSVQIGLAGANSRHGVSIKLGNASANIHISLWFTGLRRFKLYDENASDWLYEGEEFTIGTLADVGKTFEFIVAIAEQNSKYYANVLYRVAGGNRDELYFEQTGVDEKLTKSSSAASYISFGALSGSVGWTRWYSFQYGSGDSGMLLRPVSQDTPDITERQNARENGGLCLPVTGRIDLVENASGILTGGLPVAGDYWDVETVSITPTESILKPDASAWQSDTDGGWVDLRFHSDPEDGGLGFSPGAFGLFGVNFPAAWAYFTNTDVWSSPNVTIGADSYVASGTIDSWAGVAMKTTGLTRRYRPGTGKEGGDDTDWTTNIMDHIFAGQWLQMTSGAAAGYVYKISDHIAGRFTFADGSPAPAAVPGDTFRIFTRNIVGIPNAANEAASKGTYKYFRLLIPPSRTASGKYRIGACAVGPLHRVETKALCRQWDQRIGVRVPLEMTRGTDGTLAPVRKGQTRRFLSLTWGGMRHYERDAFEAFVERAGGPLTPLVYIPIHRLTGTGLSTAGCPEAVLARISNEDIDFSAQTEAEVWTHTSLALEEIPTSE